MEQKEKTGVLFVNTKKDSEKQPDFRGTITIDSIVYRLSAWQKETKAGQTISIIAQIKEGGKK